METSTTSCLRTSTEEKHCSGAQASLQNQLLRALRPRLHDVVVRFRVAVKGWNSLAITVHFRRNLPTHATTRIVSVLCSSFFGAPDASSGGLMVKAWRMEAAYMKSEASAKYRPGQILQGPCELCERRMTGKTSTDAYLLPNPNVNSAGSPFLRSSRPAASRNLSGMKASGSG